jgi:hypothetical protein
VLTRDENPLVSVVMPVYNLEHVVSAAIASVLAQTLTDLELIVVDDASTDSTPQILDYHRSNDPRVRVVRNPTNSRKSRIQWEPRNNGLQVARGEFVAYLDGDNTWDPQMLATLTTVLRRREDVQLVHCRSRNFHSPEEIDEIIAADRRPVVDRTADSVVFAHQELDPAELGRSQYIDTNEMAHRASVFQTLGSLWNTVHPRRAWVGRHQGRRCPYRRHNDLDLVERIIQAFGADSVLQVPQVLTNFYYPSARRAPVPTPGAPVPTSGAPVPTSGAAVLSPVAEGVAS